MRGEHVERHIAGATPTHVINGQSYIILCFVGKTDHIECVISQTGLSADGHGVIGLFNSHSLLNALKDAGTAGLDAEGDGLTSRRLEHACDRRIDEICSCQAFPRDSRPQFRESLAQRRRAITMQREGIVMEEHVAGSDQSNGGINVMHDAFHGTVAYAASPH